MARARSPGQLVCFESAGQRSFWFLSQTFLLASSKPCLVFVEVQGQFYERPKLRKVTVTQGLAPLRWPGRCRRSFARAVLVCWEDVSGQMPGGKVTPSSARSPFLNRCTTSCRHRPCQQTPGGLGGARRPVCQPPALAKQPRGPLRLARVRLGVSTAAPRSLQQAPLRGPQPSRALLTHTYVRGRGAGFASLRGKVNGHSL